MIKKGIRGHLGCFIAVIQLGDKPGELPGLGGVGGSGENDQVWDEPGRRTTFTCCGAREREVQNERERVPQMEATVFHSLIFSTVPSLRPVCKGKN